MYRGCIGISPICIYIYIYGIYGDVFWKMGILYGGKENGSYCRVWSFLLRIEGSGLSALGLGLGLRGRVVSTRFRV